MSGMAVIAVALGAALIVAMLVLFFLRSRPSQDAVAHTLRVTADVGALRAQVDALVQAQGSLNHSLATVLNTLHALETRLVETGSGIKTDLGHDLQEARRTVDGIRATLAAQMQADEKIHQAVTRIEAVMAGRERRGEAGEQVVAAVLRELPPALVDQGYRVKGKIVEFALMLAGGRRLAIDSKWTASDLLQRLAELPPGPEADAVAEEIERNVQRRTREVEQYISPPDTLPWAVAVIPDPAYAVCRRAHLEAFRRGVIVLPYSQMLPYLLTVYHLHQQYASSLSVDQLATALTQIERDLESLDRTLENSVARALTTLQNAAGDLKRGVGTVRVTVAGLRIPSPVSSADASGPSQAPAT